ncbi:hypothetical protein M426DRAFT_317028 [Hypoxylon sp. CI-4A]|nr:hypothetical protein M426DRAFT_317028 [Hypoxylon sp. CI-4A]
MTLEDWLDDLCVRFIINLPHEDLSSVARICFQIEEAQWFYEDFIRPLDPALPSMSLRTFTLKMFQHCPLLASFSVDAHVKAFDDFMQYKTRVPVRGAIMLNDNMDAAVLVKGYKKGASWSFPRGKINKDEDDLDCAIREVYEETGYDLREAGILEKNEPVHPLEVTMHDQQVRLYVFRGIPEDTVFGTRTRKEIGAIKWYKVEELPAYRKKRNNGKNGTNGPSHDKFYMVAPFMVQLRRWVMEQKKLDAGRIPDSSTHHHPQAFYEDATDDNVINEPVRSPAAPPKGAQYIDSATRELHRLLKMKPPTQGLQILSEDEDSQAGQTIMSLLQPGAASEELAAQDVPSDRTVAEAAYAHAPNHQHPEQRILVSNYGAGMNTGYASQHRARPYVDISTEVPHPPAYTEQPQFQEHPVQLVHPQPLPPQVQRRVLLRDMAPSPQVADATTGRAGPSALPHLANVNVQGQEAYRHDLQATHHERLLPTQLPPHSANLLNVLKGSVAQVGEGQPRQFRQTRNVSNEHFGHGLPGAPEGAANQYGVPAISSGLNNLSMTNGNVAAPSYSMRRPTDKHRAGLLDMFKKAPSVSPSQFGNQLDGGEETKQQWANQPSTASALQAAAHENGRPLQINPDANLPYGALRILSRPQSGHSPSQNTAGSVRSTSDAARYTTAGSYASPQAQFNRASPSYTNPSPRPQPIPAQRPQQIGQLSPNVYSASPHSYPYGSSQGSQPNPLALFPGAPNASQLAVPGGAAPLRQDTSVEQRNTLLSLFGKPKSFEQSKGKELALSDQFGPGPNAIPRSRLGSVASSTNESLPGFRDSTSRRESQNPLSPADRNFLLNFLENTSSGSRR